MRSIGKRREMRYVLALEEFLHITEHPPGTCQCPICKKFWAYVEKWIKESVGNEDAEDCDGY